MSSRSFVEELLQVQAGGFFGKYAPASLCTIQFQYGPMKLYKIVRGCAFKLCIHHCAKAPPFDLRCAVQKSTDDGICHHSTNNTTMLELAAHLTTQWPQATSAADGCRDANELRNDSVNCDVASIMKRWHHGGHPERSFSRCFAANVFSPNKKNLSL